MFAVALFVAWRLRRWLNQRALHKPPPLANPTDVLPCGHCGVHIPRGDAIIGANAAYCCTDHRAAAEH